MPRKVVSTSGSSGTTYLLTVRTVRSLTFLP